ncbi:MAG: sulfite exporter TauE/SafE family protein [Actinomycetota bacterium]
MNLLWALPLGLVVGATLGALGGGGAILTVPALIYLLGQEPLVATTGSLVIVGASALVGMVPHHRAGNLRVRQGLTFGLAGIVGSFGGSALSRQVDPVVLLVAFATLMLLVAVLMARRLRRSPRGATTSDTPEPSTARRLALLLTTATGVGLLTGFFGVGGGFAVVPALTLVLGFPIRAAVGTSLLVIAVNSATALASRLVLGIEGLDWPLVGTFALGAVIGSLLGGRVSAKADPRHLTVAFIAMLLAIAVLMLARNVPALL